MTLNEILQRATEDHWAIGHFNISNLEQLRAIVEAAKEVNAPIMIGTSEGERSFMGLKQAVAIVSAFREETGIPLYLNADHSKTFESAKLSIDTGYDSVHFDGSLLPYNENLAITKKVVAYRKSHNPSLSIEGELGYLPGESKIQNREILVAKEQYTNPDQACDFAQATGIDRLAIAVGNIHGIALNEPQIDLPLIKKIRAKLPSHVSLVLHAGSGIPESDITNAIKQGIANVHINTEIRVIFAEKLKEFFKLNPEETTTYKFYLQAMSAVKEKVKEKLRLFGSYDKI